MRTVVRMRLSMHNPRRYQPVDAGVATSMKNGDLIGKLRTARPLLEKEGVTHLLLFGSRARGTAGHDSDVDIAIDVAPEVKFSILNLVGVEQIVTEATGIPANAFMRRSLDKAFQSEIEREGVAVF